jgi:pantoate--beta-alanine ligase
MRTVRDPATLAEMVRGYRTDGHKIGFVPTMGALHEGHMSLVRLARKKAERVVVSIFVNPTQFGPNEDYVRYPRTESKDLQLLEQAGVDMVYLPKVAAMYPSDAGISIESGPVGRVFEGNFRPGHFNGVLTIVAKFFHQVDPHFAVFGQKDAQQLFLVRRMVRDFDFSIAIIEGETVREADGLAMSSRNVFLKTAERTNAIVLYQALQTARAAIESGVSSLTQLQTAMLDVVTPHDSIAVDYLTVVSDENFTEMDPVPHSARLIGAIRLGSVRLIDNLPVRAE